MEGFNTRKFLKADAQQIDQIKQDLDSSISSKNKIEEQTNRALLDTFLNTENSIHIDNAAENIQGNREKQKDSDNKVNVISDIDSDITFNWKKLLKKDYPEIYEKYNSILKNTTLSEKEKAEKLDFLDRLIASRASLMTANNSLMYTFKRRIYFSTTASRNAIFSELDKIEPFKGKIEIKDQELSGELHYIIKWRDEISKRVHKPKPKKPTPTPKPITPNTEKDTIDTSIDNTSEAHSWDSTSKVENSGNITQTVEVKNDIQPLADAIKEISNNLIQVLSNTNNWINKNTDIQTLSDKIDLLWKQFLMINNNPIINNNNFNAWGWMNWWGEYINIVNNLNEQFNQMVAKLEQTFDIKFENFKKQMEDSNEKNIQILINNFQQIQNNIVESSWEIPCKKSRIPPSSTLSR